MDEQKSSIGFVEDLNKGGPYAFPFVAPGALCLGMTLRDYFAAKAMHALICDHKTMMAVISASEKTGKNLPATTAGSAYEFADAMLATRSAP